MKLEQTKEVGVNSTAYALGRKYYILGRSRNTLVPHADDFKKGWDFQRFTAETNPLNIQGK